MPKSMTFLKTTKHVSKMETIVRPDGSIEEVRLCKDSFGNREKETTRIVGNKRHILNEKVDFNGYSEIVERFENFDEG